METTSSGLPNAKPRLEPPLYWWQIWMILTKKKKKSNQNKKARTNSEQFNSFIHFATQTVLLPQLLLFCGFLKLPCLKLSVAYHCPSSRNSNLSCCPSSLEPTHTWLHLVFQFLAYSIFSVTRAQNFAHATTLSCCPHPLPCHLPPLNSYISL